MARDAILIKHGGGGYNLAESRCGKGGQKECSKVRANRHGLMISLLFVIYYWARGEPHAASVARTLIIGRLPDCSKQQRRAHRGRQERRHSVRPLSASTAR